MTKNEIYGLAKKFISEETRIAAVSERTYSNIHIEAQERGIYSGISSDDTKPYRHDVKGSPTDDLYIDFQVFSMNEYIAAFGASGGEFPRLVLVLRNIEEERSDAMV